MLDALQQEKVARPLAPCVRSALHRQFAPCRRRETFAQLTGALRAMIAELEQMQREYERVGWEEETRWCTEVLQDLKVAEISAFASAMAEQFRPGA